MLLKIFISLGILFSISLVLYRFFMKKIKNYTTKTRMVALICLMLFLYVLSGILIFIIHPDKFLFLLFALSPFIIGKTAVYKYEKYYTFIQILIIVISAFYASGI